MTFKTVTFLFILLSSIAQADVCNEEVLISNSWTHVKSGDVYILESGGDMSCRNEKRHRSECDYVYSSDFIGIPESWKLIDENNISIKFDTGVFKSESRVYKCSYKPANSRLYIGELFFVGKELQADK